MFILTPGRYIVVGQLAGIALGLAVGLGLREPLAYWLGARRRRSAPLLVHRAAQKAAHRADRKQLDGFILALANALKATPSLGNALEYVEPLLPPPLRRGDRARAQGDARRHHARSGAAQHGAPHSERQLDATLSGLLIGRQVGGELPKILETTAATLREMARLEGVVRTKTAEGKAQLLVWRCFPRGGRCSVSTCEPRFFVAAGSSTVRAAFIIGMCVALWVVGAGDRAQSTGGGHMSAVLDTARASSTPLVAFAALLIGAYALLRVPGVESPLSRRSRPSSACRARVAESAWARRRAGACAGSGRGCGRCVTESSSAHDRSTDHAGRRLLGPLAGGVRGADASGDRPRCMSLGAGYAMASGKGLCCTSIIGRRARAAAGRICTDQPRAGAAQAHAERLPYVIDLLALGAVRGARLSRIAAAGRRENQQSGRSAGRGDQSHLA